MYKLKNGVELPKEFKIKVNPEQSKALQEHLFNIGYKWQNGEKIVKNIENLYIYIDTSGIQFGRNEYNFDCECDYEEINFEDYFEPKQFPEKWCIQVTEENYEELRDWMHKNSSNYGMYESSSSIHWMSFKELTIGKTFYSYGYSWSNFYKDVSYEEITTEQFREQFGVNCDHIVSAVNNLGRSVSELGGGSAFEKMADKIIPVDKPKPELQMSDEAQIVFNILYKRGIKFDRHDFEVYLRVFEEGVNFQKNKL